jgi:hypothetical protein
VRSNLARATRHRNSFDELPRLLVSFLKFSGWRLLRDDIRRFLDRRPGGLRVLTTTA